MRVSIAMAVASVLAMGATTLALVQTRRAPAKSSSPAASLPSSPPRTSAPARPAAPVRAPVAAAQVEAAQRLESAGQREAAENQYRQILDADPTNVAACIGIGRIIRGRSDVQAKEMLERAVELDPRSAEAHQELAVTETHLKEYAEARRHAEIALELDPTGPRAEDLADLIAFLNNMLPHR